MTRILVLTAVVLASVALAQSAGAPLTYSGLLRQVDGGVFDANPVIVSLRGLSTCDSDAGASVHGYFSAAIEPTCRVGLRRRQFDSVAVLAGGHVLLTPLTQVPAADRAVGSVRGISVSLSGLLCGFSAQTEGQFTAARPDAGPVSSYQAAKVLCERVTTCGSAAHQCSRAELERSAQAGALLGVAATAVTAWVGGDERNCDDWTSRASTESGRSAQIRTSGSLALWTSDCGSNLAIACCE